MFQHLKRQIFLGVFRCPSAGRYGDRGGKSATFTFLSSQTDDRPGLELGTLGTSGASGGWQMVPLISLGGLPSGNLT